MRRTLNQSIVRFALTTGEVSRICHVAPRTVSKWTDRKKNALPSYRTGEKQVDRRIPRDALVKWLIANKMPLHQLEDPACPRILFVCRGIPLPKQFKGPDVSVRMVENIFDAGVECQAFLPACVVIDCDACGGNPVTVCSALRKYPTRPVILGVAEEDPSLTGIVDSFMSKPFTEDALKIRVLNVCSGRYPTKP